MYYRIVILVYLRARRSSGNSLARSGWRKINAPEMARKIAENTTLDVSMN